MNFDPLILLAGLIALFSSFVGAFAGGGSLILLSCLILLFPDSYLSHLTIVKISALFLVLTSSQIHLKKNKFNLPFLFVITFTAVVGMILGTYLVQFVLKEEFIYLFLGILLLLLPIYYVFTPRIGLNVRSHTDFTPGETVLGGIALFFFALINALSGGMGFILNAYFVLVHRFSFIQATAYGMLSGIIVIGLQVAYLMTQVSLNLHLVASVVIGSIVGAYLGTHFQYQKGNLWVKGAASFVMLILGIEMLF